MHFYLQWYKRKARYFWDLMIGKIKDCWVRLKSFLNKLNFNTDHFAIRLTGTGKWKLTAVMMEIRRGNNTLKKSLQLYMSSWKIVVYLAMYSVCANDIWILDEKLKYILVGDLEACFLFVVKLNTVCVLLWLYAEQFLFFFFPFSIPTSVTLYSYDIGFKLVNLFLQDYNTVE